MGNNNSSNNNNNYDFSTTSDSVNSLDKISSDSRYFYNPTVKKINGGSSNKTIMKGGTNDKSLTAHMDLLEAIEEKINTVNDVDSEDSEFYNIIKNKLNLMGGDNTDIFIKALNDNNYNKQFDTITPNDILKNIAYGGNSEQSDNELVESDDESESDDSQEGGDPKSEHEEHEEQEKHDSESEHEEQSDEETEDILQEGGRVYLPVDKLDDDEDEYDDDKDLDNESSSTTSRSSSDEDEDEDYNRLPRGIRHKGKKVRIARETNKSKGKGVKEIFITSPSESTPYLLSTSSINTDDVNIVNYSP